jgi:hypothetical protein
VCADEDEPLVGLLFKAGTGCPYNDLGAEVTAHGIE